MRQNAMKAIRSRQGAGKGVFAMKLIRVVLCLSAGLVAALAQNAAAPASLPLVSPIFGDSMVLQRGKPNTIWGWSQPGETVRVETVSYTHLRAHETPEHL